MRIVAKNRRIGMSRRQVLFGFGALVAWLTLVASNFGPFVAFVLLGIIYFILRYTTKPLSRVIARLGYSIRWKFEVGIAVVAILFPIVSLIQIAAMTFMHNEIHVLQELMAARQFGQVSPAINDLEDTHHGAFYQLLPFLGVLGVLGAAAVGGAMAWSVISPLHSMGRAMRRFASGDFSEPVDVENRDELGELADSINQTGEDLVRLQEAKLVEERARSLQERIARVTLAQEEERRRISRELHDGLGPSLAAIGNRIRASRRMVHSDPDKADKELQEVAASLKGNVQEIRELIHGLRPLTLDQLGLSAALGQYLEQFGKQTGIQGSINVSGQGLLDPLTEITAFRVVQECLTNVQKHSNASQVEVSLDFKDTGFEARVKDNGKGFDPDVVAAGAGGQGMGLLSMKERVELIQGSLSVNSHPEAGCEITLYAPAKEAGVGTG